jgi:hypothetical protein
MNSVLDFIVKPVKSRYNNTKKINDKELILNSEIYTHQFVSRIAEVLAVPKINKTEIEVGDHVIVHHNVFRRYHDQYGVEKNSRSYFKEDMYFVREDQVYMYKRVSCSVCDWTPLKGYIFVKPIKSNNILNSNKEEPLIGVIKHCVFNKLYNKGDLVGFKPNSEYEFIIDDERLYRVLTDAITIKYEYQGNEEEYNPSWAQGS